MTHKYKLDKDGSFTSTYLLKKDFVVPVGYYLCMYLLPLKRRFEIGTRLDFLNYQKTNLPAAAGPANPTR